MESLGDWIRARPLEPQDAIGWVVRVARGVETLHALDVPHGRITAEAVHCSAPAANAAALMLDADEVPRDYQYYSARRCKLSGASREDDVWALGVLLYYAVTGAYPFEGADRREVRERIEWRPASPLDVYDVDHEGLQMVLDRVFKADETLRLVTLRTLIDTLVALHPAADGLPELGFGEPEGADIELDLRTWARRGRDSLPDRSSQPEAEQEDEPPVAALPPMRDLQLTNVDPDPLGIFDLPSEDDGEDEQPTREMRRPGSLGDLVPAEEPEAPASEQAEISTAPPPPRSASAPASRPTPSRSLVDLTEQRHTLFLLVAVCLFLAGGSLALWFFPKARPKRAARPPPSASAPTTPVAAPTATSSAAAASASAAPAPAPPPAARADVAACVAEMFEPGTFAAGKPKVSFVCTESDPRKAADALKTEVTLGKGERDVTPAMRLLEELGWYDMAFLSAARARCCIRPVPIRSSSGGAPCDYDVVLTALGRTVVEGSEKELQAAMARYSTAVHCLVGMDAAKSYGQKGPPRRFEASSFLRAVGALREPPSP